VSKSIAVKTMGMSGLDRAIVIGMLLIATAPGAIAGTATYGPTTNSLYLPDLKVGGLRANGLAIQLNSFSDVSVSGAMTGETTFDLSSSMLTMPSLGINGTYYHGVAIRLNDYRLSALGSLVDEANIKVNSPANLAVESSADYNSNLYGIITGKTLKLWKDDWSTYRPAGIKGKLVILQMTTGEAGFEYVKANGSNVFSYLALSAEWTMTRANGVLNTPTMVLDGPGMDAQLKKYNIDPVNDLIVLASGSASAANVMGQGRAWFALRYWGVDAMNIAVLNGGNKWQSDSGAMAAGDFLPTVAPAPAFGMSSVRDLARDNMALQATLADMLAIIPSSDTNMKNDGVLIWDARTVTQYSAGQKREKRDADSGCASAYCDAAATYDYMASFQNGGSRQGHPFGALNLNYLNVLDDAKGYGFKTKAELAAFMNGASDANGYALVDGSYNPVGEGNGYQPGDTVYAYCETSQRGVIAAIVSGVILGHPTRLYDGAMVEWSSLSNLSDQMGKAILPADSPWRTDTRSFYRPAMAMGQVVARTIVDPYALHSNGIIAADRAYKAGTTITTPTTTSTSTTSTSTTYMSTTSTQAMATTTTVRTTTTTTSDPSMEGM